MARTPPSSPSSEGQEVATYTDNHGGGEGETTSCGLRGLIFQCLFAGARANLSEYRLQPPTPITVRVQHYRHLFHLFHLFPHVHVHLFMFGVYHQHALAYL